MKAFVQYSLAASFAAGAVADAHHHHHHARHHAGSQVEKREADPVIEYVVGPTETVYELGGEVIDADKAKEGIEEGDYVVIGETTPTFSAPPPPPEPTTSSAPEMGAQFFESKSETTTSTSTSTSTTPPPPPPTTSKAEPTSTSEAPKPKPTKEPVSVGGGEGIDADFPSGEIKCSEFPSKYGALSLDWLDMGGWAGLQFVPGFSLLSTSISEIHTGISGETCSKGCMCSYACPAGYQKTQWPSAQGSTKQSIGGLYCNSDGYLELTRGDESKKLCEKGQGGVTIQNDLDVEVATCRTDYPGTESMVVPAVAEPGSKVEVCNPDQDGYYIWDGMSTSAQYYINKKGYGAKDACVWNSPIDPEGAGNWSPLILGVGKAKDGITYISIFQNLPTSHAKLDFNIEITGDVNSKCAYVNGKFTGGSDGCTTGMRDGGKAVVRYY